VTATSPISDILLRDPREDPMPAILESILPIILSPDTIALLEEIWTTKQRVHKQLLIKKAYRWMVGEGKQQISTRAGRRPRPTTKRAQNEQLGDDIIGKKRRVR
jgi:hypothetical protein